MTPIKILIADDEAPARRKIRNFLKSEEAAGEILEAESGAEAVGLIETKKPDLVFLDIQMPGRTGLEVVEAIGPERMPAVVFVTAYDQYAVQAFEVQAVDYLLKPFDEERFRKAFRRAVERQRRPDHDGAVLERLLADLRGGAKPLQRLMVNRGPRYFFIRTADVFHIQAEEKYLDVHTEKESFLMRETLSEMEAKLDPARFARIHRSTIVNVDHIREIQPWSHGDALVILKNGTQLTLSRRYRDRLFPGH